MPPHKFHEGSVFKDDSVFHVFLVAFVAAAAAAASTSAGRSFPIGYRADGRFEGNQRQGAALEGERFLHDTRGSLVGLVGGVGSGSSLGLLFPRREVLFFLLPLHHGLSFLGLFLAGFGRAFATY